MVFLFQDSRKSSFPRKNQIRLELQSVSQSYALRVVLFELEPQEKFAWMTIYVQYNTYENIHSNDKTLLHSFEVGAVC